MTAPANDGGWCTVRKARRSKKSKRSRQDPTGTALLRHHSSDSEEQEPVTDEAVDVLQLRLQRCLHSTSLQQLISSTLAQLVAAMVTAEAALQSQRWTVLCYGLGSPSACVRARLQLALWNDLLDRLSDRVHSGRGSILEPVLTPLDGALLSRLGFATAENRHNDRGWRHFPNGPALIYLPHCGRPLLHNLLHANWSAAKLSGLVLLGNSVRRLVDYSPRRHLQEFPCLLAAARFTQDSPLQLTDRDGRCAKDTGLDTVFNDMSVQCFPWLSEVADDVWRNPELRLHQEPTYSPEVAVELKKD